MFAYGAESVPMSLIKSCRSSSPELKQYCRENGLAFSGGSAAVAWQPGNNRKRRNIYIALSLRVGIENN